MPFYDSRKKMTRQQKRNEHWNEKDFKRPKSSRSYESSSFSEHHAAGTSSKKYRDFSQNHSGKPERRAPKPGSQQSRSSRGQEWTPAPKPVSPAPVRTAPPPERYGVNGEYETPYTREPENLLSGRNPIREALKADRDIEKLLVAKGDLAGSAREIVSMLEDARAKEEPPFLVVLDGITDPHNLGAIIRTAACVGVHGVIVPMRRAAGLTPAAVKASAGAVETVRVARVTNLVNTIKELKNQGIWIYAADMDGEDYRTLSMEAPMALLIGSEGEGISRLALDNADFKVRLPMYGGVSSLNASVAAGVLMYAAVKNR